jgi:PAS domain S-box-containing protein
VRLTQIVASWTHRLFHRQRRDLDRDVRPSAQDLGQYRDLSTLIGVILDQVEATWQTETAALVLRDPREGSYRVRGVRGFPQGPPAVAFAGESATARFLAPQQQPVPWPQEAALPSQEEYALHSLRGVFIVPFQFQGQMFGWLHVGPRRSGQAYTPADAQLLVALAGQAGSALEYALLYEYHRRELAALEALNRIGLAATTMEWEGLLEEIYHEVAQLVDATDFYIALYDPAANEFSYAFWVEGGVRQPNARAEHWPFGAGLTSAIVRSGEPIVTQDYLAECARRGVRPPGRDTERRDMAWLGVPLQAGTQVLGALSISSPAASTVYQAEDVQLLATIAAQAAVVIERSRLRTRERQRVSELETLNEIAQVIGSSLRLDDLLPAIARAVQRGLDAPSFAIALHDAARAEFRLALYGEGEQLGRAEDSRWPVSSGLTGEIARERRPIVTDDYTAECTRRGLKGSGRHGKAWMGVPMLLGEELVGVLIASSSRPETVYTEDDVRLLTTIAAQAATAIANARLYERTAAALSRRLEELTAIDVIAQELNTSLDLRHVLDVVLGRAMAATGATTAGVAMRTPDGAGLLMLSCRGCPPDIEQFKTQPWSVEKGIIGRTIRTGRPALVDDVRQDPDYAEITPAVISELAVPIAFAGQPIGVINLECDRPAAFDEEHLRFVQRLAAHAATAINNARLFQERERRITEMAIFNEIGGALASALDLGTLLETIHQQVSRLFDTTDFYIATYDEETDEWETVLDIGEGQKRPLQRHRLGTGLTGHIIRCRSPLLFRTASEVEAFSSLTGTPMVGQMACSWLGVPLIAADKVVGVMGIENYERENLYSDQDLTLFAAIAAQAAIAIDNARLFRRVAEARDRLQAVLDSTRDGILLLDKDGGILLANPAVERYTGLDHSQLGNMTVLELIKRVTRTHPKVRRALLEELGSTRRVLERNPLAPIRGSVEAPSPDSPTVEWVSLPVLQRNGQRMARIVVLRDVTEERAAERMRQDLDSMIVHDLRGPLTIILGSLETALHADVGPLTETQAGLLTMAQKGAQRMQSLVDILLDIRRLEAGKMPQRFAPVALAELAERAIGQIEPLARESRLTLAMEVAPDLPPLRADAETLTRVLENLLSNAVKHAYTGGLIRVQAEQEGRVVRCAVVDYGVGIPNADLERIFEKYVQVSRAGKYRGTGLGLAFCRLAVEAHGGRIWAESEEGKGSTFYFTVPVWEE